MSTDTLVCTNTRSFLNTHAAAAVCASTGLRFNKQQLISRTHRPAAPNVYLLLSLSRIKHENIVALEDIYESSNHLYLIMQL